jgi:hypothetical protein
MSQNKEARRKPRLFCFFYSKQENFCIDDDSFCHPVKQMAHNNNVLHK